MLAEKIKNKRKELRLTQEYVAENLGISRQAVSKWEKGLSVPSMDNLIKLSEIFKVDMDYFKDDSKSYKSCKNEKKEESIFVRVFWYMIYIFIAFFFFLIYYFGIMEGLLNLNPKELPYLILTMYLAVAVFSFPQAIKDLGEKISDLNYNLFSKIILPLVFILSPLIVLYYIVKKW